VDPDLCRSSNPPPEPYSPAVAKSRVVPRGKTGPPARTGDGGPFFRRFAPLWPPLRCGGARCGASRWVLPAADPGAQRPNPAPPVPDLLARGPRPSPPTPLPSLLHGRSVRGRLPVPSSAMSRLTAATRQWLQAAPRRKAPRGQHRWYSLRWLCCSDCAVVDAGHRSSSLSVLHSVCTVVVQINLLAVKGG
jgi:hypothetical protein